MNLQLGRVELDFTADTSSGSVHFREWKKSKWAMLFPHPKDYAPVRPTEMDVFARRIGEFEKTGAKIIGLSADSTYDHESWEKDIARVSGATMSLPLIVDPNPKIAEECLRYVAAK